MNNKNTIKDLIELMEQAGESDRYIIGWLLSMIDASATKALGFDMQRSIDNGIRFYSDKALVAGRVKVLQN